MKILFRVDAGGTVGLGHFYRSLDVADSLKARGHNVVFSHLRSDFWTKQLSLGFNYLTIELESCNQENKTAEYILKENIEVYYVDGIIDFTIDFFCTIGLKPKTVFYQNVGKSRNLANVFISPAVKDPLADLDDTFIGCKKYEGLEYFCFNSHIRGIQRKSINPDFGSLAVSAGGSDPGNTLLQMYKLFDHDDFSYLEIKFYFGSDFMHNSKIPTTHRDNIEFLSFNHSHILEQDALVSAFGVSVYEFLYLGMPVIAYGHVERNALVSDVLAQETKALVSLGEIKNLTSLELLAAVNEISEYSLRKEISEKAKMLLDLKGVERVVEIIEKCVAE